jgi:hypothetical protein
VVGLFAEPKSEAAAHSCTHAHRKMGRTHTHAKEAVELPISRRSLTCAQCNTHAMAAVQVLKSDRKGFAATSLRGWGISHAKMKERRTWISSHLFVAVMENGRAMTNTL